MTAEQTVRAWKESTLHEADGAAKVSSMTDPSLGATASTVRLVASDLDGTLFGVDAELTPRTISALRAVDAAGVAVVAATGRSHRTASPRLAPAGVVRTVICSNGASVHDIGTGETLLHRPIEDDVLDELVPLLRSHFDGVALAWEVLGDFGWESGFVDLAPPERRDAFRTGDRSAEVHESIDLVRPRQVTKLMVAHPELARNQWLMAVEPVLPAEVTASTSGAHFVEITGHGVDKGSTLATMCEQWGVDRTEVLAFGDQANDVTMLEWAGRSMAVSGAQEVAVAAADEVIGPHTDDAVAGVLEELVATLDVAAG